ncbi:hypothetical protein GOL82_26385 [Sinorhizobium medicae]|nr:hypothetical protein [Sinorhizobium medicae]MDX0420174.1 hypothetical protein [Sinorhizobium medicae]MDX1034722.1 hypothetical protein [Sinorhizobium medicae]
MSTKSNGESAEQVSRETAFQIEDKRVQSEQFLTVWKAIFEYAQIAIRAILLANGAGATAILTFLGHALDKNATPVNKIALGLSGAAFAIGVALGVLTAFLAYLSQYDVIRMAIASGGKVPVGTASKRIAGIVLAFAGLAFFLIGVGAAIYGFLQPWGGEES